MYDKYENTVEYRITCELVRTEDGYDFEFTYSSPEPPPLMPLPNNLIIKESSE